MFLVFYFLKLTFQIMYPRCGRMRRDHWIDWRWLKRKRSWPSRGTVPYSRESSLPAQRGYSPLTLATTVGGKTYRACKKHDSLSLHELISAGRHFLGVSSIVPKVKFIGSCIILQAQNTTTFLPNVFFKWNILVTVHQQRTVGRPHSLFVYFRAAFA
jgi:hypothetical protein